MVKCPACGCLNTPEKYLTFYTSRGYDDSWAKCKECRAYFMTGEFDKEIEEKNTEVNSSRNQQHGEFHNTYKKRMYEFVLAQIAVFDKTARRILDIGSSYGGFLFLAQVKGYEAAGTEIASSAVAYMRERGIDAHRVFSIKDIPTDTKFDVITALDSNMYWQAQDSELDAINMRLKANGMFIMRTADKTFFVKAGFLLKKLFSSAGYKVIRKSINDHRFAMPVSSLLKLLKNKGFEIKKVSVKGAIHSFDSSFLVKVIFWAGALIYSITGIFLAPGIVIIAQKK